MRILLIFILFSAVYLTPIIPAHAAKGPKMETIYGEDLMKVPPLIRLKFQNNTGRSWDDTTQEERTQFLSEWQTHKAADKADEENRAQEIKNEKKQLAKKELNKSRLKRNKERAARDKEKARMAEKKTEDKKKQELVKKRTKTMRSLKKSQKARNRDN